MNTPYERLESHLLFENHLLTVDKISLKTTALLGEGSGAIDLDNVQCDVNLTLDQLTKNTKNWHCLFAFSIVAMLHNTS